jgi:hypothetical protein
MAVQLITMVPHRITHHRVSFFYGKAKCSFAQNMDFHVSLCLSNIKAFLQKLAILLKSSNY